MTDNDGNAADWAGDKYVDYVLTERHAPPAQVPDGWQIVPKEPTHGMCQQCDSPRTAQAYYRAMLAAAPKPTQQPAQVPDALPIPDEIHGLSRRYAIGWNDCREAMLAAHNQKEPQ